MNVVNRIAPEHLEIMVQEPMSVLPFIENAGADLPWCIQH